MPAASDQNDAAFAQNSVQIEFVDDDLPLANIMEHREFDEDLDDDFELILEEDEANRTVPLPGVERNGNREWSRNINIRDNVDFNQPTAKADLISVPRRIEALNCEQFPRFPHIEEEHMNIPDTLSTEEQQFITSLTKDENEINDIEVNTRAQADCEEWNKQRCHRFTASKFHLISHRKRNHNTLAETLIHPKKFSNRAVEHGRNFEPVALMEYQKYMKNARTPVKVFPSGFVISKSHPILGASPDAKVIDPGCLETFGLAEVKCPYKVANVAPIDACSDPKFCMEKTGTDTCQLKKNHEYYAQVQGQMADTGCRCSAAQSNEPTPAENKPALKPPSKDELQQFYKSLNGTSHQFVKQRLLPDIEHWETQIPKLETFWRICVLPEILGRWYTRNMDLKSQISPRESWPSGDCHCRKSTNEETVTCANPECKVSIFHPSCLCIDKLKVTNFWYYPHCRKLPQFARPKSKKMPDLKDQYMAEAAKLDKICVCQEKAEPHEKLLKCHNELCSSGKFFHVACMSYKRYPNNARTT
ncbi:hypothetical protein AWC38_SpisGene5183 [Stylophora pistillata]|uniref:YqaJ viral recombinase domain-containing protein n=1 Tax=Stylophora pistillata TaxID=50429 RepID=A0A2B4SNH8_STYPI|nr:hypothetical protein AWC38_SpisGene5183 [Stylophora pistillata]